MHGTRVSNTPQERPGMPKQPHAHLSRRESQIMDVVYRLGSATAAQVHESIADPPSYSAVRALLAVLERKGQLRHKKEGPRYVFLPTRRPDVGGPPPLRRCPDPFFEGSAEKPVAALLDIPESTLTDEDYERLTRLIQQARK